MSETIIIRNRRRTGKCEDCSRKFECSVMATRKVCCDRCARRRKLAYKRDHNRMTRGAKA